MNKILGHVETARNAALGQSLNDIHQTLVKFRLFGLHMLDRLDKRLVKDFDDLADKIEDEINRLNALEHGPVQEVTEVSVDEKKGN